MQQPSGGAAASDINGTARTSGKGALAKELKNPEAPPQDSRQAAADELDLHALLDALQAMRMGDFSVRMPSNQIGLAGKVADAFNDIVAINQRMAQELEVVGKV